MDSLINFNEDYYNQIIFEFGYNPLYFQNINFCFKNISKETLRMKWLCHHNADKFVDFFEKGEKSIISTGIGLSGVPHIGTVSQILRAILIQKSNIPVNLVLGDLDAFNGKNTPLYQVQALAKKYRDFIRRLGFKESNGSILRTQFEELNVLKTSYIIGHYMNDEMFMDAEEDLYEFYKFHKKIDSSMSYRRKLSLNLMIADFLDLYFNHNFKNILISLGIDEHKYSRFCINVIKNIRKDKINYPNFNVFIGEIYTPLIRGLKNYSKMSKSFPNSGISVNDSPETIFEKIRNGEGNYKKPDENVVFQMIMWTSDYEIEKIQESYKYCLENKSDWKKAKEEYAEYLIKITKLWN